MPGDVPGAADHARPRPPRASRLVRHGPRPEV